MEQEKVCVNYKYVFKRNLLRNKVAFITGGGSGICFTIAEILMRHQCDTVIAGRNYDRLKNSAQLLMKTTGQLCLPVRVDVRKPEEIMYGVDKVLTDLGKIDILVNGAAGNFVCAAAGLSPNGFRTVMDIDAMGTFNVSKIVYEKYMQDHGGVIVNITATLHLRGSPLQVHAGSAKAAIEAMGKHLAVEWGHSGVRVMCVAPGPVSDTEGIRRLGNLMEDSWVREIPVQRIGTREDIANTVLYVVSDAAQLLTGSTIIVDGGHWLTSSFSLKADLTEFTGGRNKAKL